MAFGESRKLHERFKFVVETTRFGFAAFQKASELKVDVAKIDYFEGGTLIPIKDPGRLTFSDCTLTRGASDNLDFFNWIKQVANPAAGEGGAGAVSPAFKDNVSLIQRERDNSDIREWTLMGAWPMSYTAGDWDNTVDEVVIEQLVLTYDWFEALA